MSKDWVEDIRNMHAKYGVHEWVEKHKDNPEMLARFLDFRLSFLREELEETQRAVLETKDAGEVVDGLIDLCVVAIGTLDAFNVDAEKAWNIVWNANMRKRVGVKESRPNPLGLPDLIKPEGWKAPNHDDNTGYITDAL